MKTLFLSLSLLFLASFAWGQGAQFPLSSVQDYYGNAQPGAKVEVCAATLLNTPCTPSRYVTIYTDYTIANTLTQPIFADASGNFTFGCTLGTNYQISVAARATRYVYNATCPGGSGGGGGTGTVTSVTSGSLSPLFSVSVSNPNTVPSFTFSQSTVAPSTVFGNPSTTSSGVPVFTGSPVVGNITATNGTITNLTITNCTGCPGTPVLSAITAATGPNSLANAANTQTWNWSFGAANNTNGFALGESVKATGTGDVLFNVSTLSTSTALPLQVTAGGMSNGIQMSTAGALSAIGSGSIAATTAGSATTATTTTNLAGGSAGTVPYQSGAGATAMLAVGTNGQCLVLTTGLPAWGSCATGAGTVTVAGGGNLTSTALLTGGGTQVVQTPSATSTLDSSGNLKVAAGGSVGSADTGTPKFTFGTNSITANQVITATTGFLIASGANTAGHYLRNNGTNYIDGTISAADLPSLSGTYLALAGGTMAGNVLFSPDSTYNIGANGATRPNNGYFGGILSSTSYTATGSGSPDIYTEQAAPGGNPSAGQGYTWFDSTQHRLNDKNSSGVVGTTSIPATCAGSNWFNSLGANGAYNCLQPQVTDVVGAAPIANPSFTGLATFTPPTGTSPAQAIATRGLVSTSSTANNGAVYLTSAPNDGIANALATNVTWTITQLQVTSTQLIFTISTPVNAISWTVNDCFQVAGFSNTDVSNAANLNAQDFAVAAKSDGTPTSTITVTIAGTANTCQTGTVSGTLPSVGTYSSFTHGTPTTNRYDTYLNGNTFVYNRLISSSANCALYGSIRLCGTNSASDKIVGRDSNTGNDFVMLQRWTGSPPASKTTLTQIGDPSYGAIAPGGMYASTLTLYGATSGSASIAATATAGSPSTWQMPTTDPTNGQYLKSGTPSGGNVPISWGNILAADVPAPTTTVSSGSISVTTNNTYVICTTTCTVTPVAPAAGLQLCVRNAPGSATVITMAALGSGNYYELTDHTAWGTANHSVVSGGAATDSICLVGYDTHHYAVMSYSGVWTD